MKFVSSFKTLLKRKHELKKKNMMMTMKKKEKAILNFDKQIDCLEFEGLRRSRISEKRRKQSFFVGFLLTVFLVLVFIHSFSQLEKLSCNNLISLSTMFSPFTLSPSTFSALILQLFLSYSRSRLLAVRRKLSFCLRIIELTASPNIRMGN